MKDRAESFRTIPSPLAGLRALVVEDEGLVGLLVEEFLERSGYKLVGVAGSTPDALQIIRTATVEVAVVDGLPTTGRANGDSQFDWQEGRSRTRKVHPRR